MTDRASRKLSKPGHRALVKESLWSSLSQTWHTSISLPDAILNGLLLKLPAVAHEILPRVSRNSDFASSESPGKRSLLIQH